MDSRLYLQYSIVFFLFLSIYIYKILVVQSKLFLWDKKEKQKIKTGSLYFILNAFLFLN
jgi:hypothetical protein